MQIIAISNQKGGCAKTTTAVNLAAGFAQVGLNVLLIDLDPQGNASDWLGVTDTTQGSAEIFSTELSLDDLIRASSLEHISVIAGSASLSSVERLMLGKPEPEQHLRKRLSSLSFTRWDYILLDTPPTLGLLTVNALAAAHQLLVPVTTQVLSLSGVAQLMDMVSHVRVSLNPTLALLGLLASRVDIRTLHAQDVIEALAERFGDKLLKTRIRENVRLAEAPSFKKSIFQYRPKSGAADDYRALVQEILPLTR